MLRRLAIALVVAGLSLFAVAGYQLVDAARYQRIEQRQLQQALEARAAATGQHPGASRDSWQGTRARQRAARGEPWARLEIGRLGLSVMVDEGVDPGTLRRAVGHVPGTAFPGEVGNVVLAGHRDGLFRPLRLVHDGDRIRVTTPDGAFDYEVTSSRVVDPERTDAVDPVAGRSELSLVTCYPFYYVGPAPQRYIVRAQLVSPEPASVSAQPAHGGAGAAREADTRRGRDQDPQASRLSPGTAGRANGRN
jgi:sortase A